VLIIALIGNIQFQEDDLQVIKTDGPISLRVE